MTKLIINAPFGNIKPLVNLELLVNLEDGGLIGYRPHQMMMRSKRETPPLGLSASLKAVNRG
ncbi:hypothetical protein A8M58_04255 [Yersinia pestis]|nr:hypothetical protein AU254_04715 [Yersinia pestis]PVU32074.1 hypothetical protein A8M58_04255 [Yersinia pestis]